MSEGQEFLTQEEFAAVLRVSLSTVKRWVASGAVRYWQAPQSGVVRIPKSEINRHLHPRLDQLQGNGCQ